MTEKKPMIILTRYSPYYLIDLQEIQKADGEKNPSGSCNGCLLMWRIL